MSHTEINISFDTEDFTSNRAADAILNTALLLKEEGIRADYNVVGLLAKQLVNWRRFDVLDALKYHEISFHSKTHSLHPTLCEYEDLADFDAAYKLTLREEMEGMGMVRAATGATRLAAGCPPGSSFSYIAQYVYAENGIGAYTGSSVYLADGSPIHMCGLLHMQYNAAFETMSLNADYDLDALLDRLSKQKRVIVYNHPNRITHAEFWDKVNYYRENTHPWGEWEEAPLYKDGMTEHFYDTIRKFVRLAKEAKNEDGSPKFVFKTINEIVDSEKRERTVRRADMSVYLDALKKSLADGSFNLLTLSDTAAEKISLSECLYAATTLIMGGGDEVSLDGKLLRGFLSAPQGLTASATLTRDEVTRAANTINFDKFLPSSFACGIYKIGPLDLLIALLTFLCNPEQNEVALEVVPQQPSLDLVPGLRDQNLKGAWVFSDSFEDKYMSDRLRWQAWTAHR